MGDIKLAVGLGIMLGSLTAAFLLGRRGRRPDVEDRYVLPQHGRGLFVLTRRTEGTWSVVTYARFGESQREFVRERWLAPGPLEQDVPNEAA